MERLLPKIFALCCARAIFTRLHRRTPTRLILVRRPHLVPQRVQHGDAQFVRVAETRVVEEGHLVAGGGGGGRGRGRKVQREQGRAEEGARAERGTERKTEGTRKRAEERAGAGVREAGCGMD